MRKDKMILNSPSRNSANASRLITAFLLFFLLAGHSPLFAQQKVRPFILVTPAERAKVLEKIETQDWAKSIYTDFIDEIDEEVNKYQQDPEVYQKYLSVD